jgi:hypothetical protein
MAFRSLPTHRDVEHGSHAVGPTLPTHLLQ